MFRRLMVTAVLFASMAAQAADFDIVEFSEKLAQQKVMRVVLVDADYVASKTPPTLAASWAVSARGLEGTPREVQFSFRRLDADTLQVGDSAGRSFSHRIVNTTEDSVLLVDAEGTQTIVKQDGELAYTVVVKPVSTKEKPSSLLSYTTVVRAGEKLPPFENVSMNLLKLGSLVTEEANWTAMKMKQNAKAGDQSFCAGGGYGYGYGYGYGWGYGSAVGYGSGGFWTSDRKDAARYAPPAISTSASTPYLKSSDAK